MDAGVSAIRLVLSDVDGTLVDEQKELTSRTIAAVQQLHAAGIHFAVTSGRPPRGMHMLIEPLALRTPLAGFNGGVIVDGTMKVIQELVIPSEIVASIVGHIEAAAIDVWLYRGADWYVRDLEGAHVMQHAATVEFEPTLVDSFDDLRQGVAKIVGVSEDHAAVEAAAVSAHDRFGGEVSATRSSAYYLDVTHPDANKGSVARYHSEALDIPSDAIAAIGDMPNDVLMFAHSGLSIAMGNASLEVQRASRRVTSSNDEDGFAIAMERFILT